MGTIGHIDHGKTTLTSAITKVLARKEYAKYMEYGQIDKAPEEKARGITINTATLEYHTEKRHYGMHRALLSSRGLPRTHRLRQEYDHRCGQDGRRHLGGGRHRRPHAPDQGAHPSVQAGTPQSTQIGVNTIIVFVNKCDMIKDPEMIEVIEMELKEILKKHEYDPEKVKFVRGSALHAMNGTEPEIGENKVVELLDVMDNFIPIPARPVDKPFLMSIEGTYNIEGRGAVATGTVEQGRVKVGD